MTRRGDPVWRSLMASRTITASIITLFGFFILVTDPGSVWVGVALVVLGAFALALLAVARRRGRY
ncbi:hypothetical protein [Curtobacterium citreum]|uniref:Secreted protein with PEP-CTERM sorting signal n=1 Tax=Curtobacterium citreum TaxID=2036 RepID=A0ABT2HIX7_9MICO|nr:hypothetical protein [Curtobacterium citreum]MCS6523228.1 hypothetical protein [Curtobacterium citreum]TQJ26900.1 hypothetical protein FB462_0744 [Curtobacterium citreum]